MRKTQALPFVKMSSPRLPCLFCYGNAPVLLMRMEMKGKSPSCHRSAGNKRFHSIVPQRAIGKIAISLRTKRPHIKLHERVSEIEEEAR